MARPDLSVVVPTRNRPSLLPVAVASVLAQTYDDLEVVVVDDASDRPAIAALAGLDDHRIRLLRHETNIGLAAARNSGIAAARGERIAFLDDDNTWEPTFLEHLVAAADAYGDGPGVVAASAATVRDEVSATTSVVAGARDGSTTLATLVDGVHPFASSLLVPRTLLDIHGGFDERLGRFEDYDLFLRWAAADVTFVHVPEPLLNRRVHRDSLSFDHERGLRAERRLQSLHRDTIAARLGSRAARRWSRRRWAHLRAGGVERHLEAGDRRAATRTLAAMAPTAWSHPLWFAKGATKVALGLDRYRAGVRAVRRRR